MLSGNCSAYSKKVAEQAGVNVAKFLGCDGATDVAGCLRGKTPSEVAAVPYGRGENTAKNAANVDGLVLRGPPLELIGTPGFDRVPVVVSTTKDDVTENLGLFDGSRPIKTEPDYVARVKEQFGIKADGVLAKYPVADFPSPMHAFISAYSDALFACPSRAALRQLSRSATPNWRAVFTYAIESGPRKGLSPHGADLAYGFRNLDKGRKPPSAGSQRLSDSMAGAWVRFAASGDPNGGGLTEWSRYDAVRDNYLQLDVPPASGAGFRTSYCDFWDE
jgi:para-nitrobenzyl esterase